MRLSLLLLLSLFSILPAWSQEFRDGATNGSVNVTSASVGVRVGPSGIRLGVRVRVPDNAAVPVCFAYVDYSLDCSSALTVPENAGFCATAGNGYAFLVSEEGFKGQVCTILLSGTTAVAVGFNAW